MPESRSLMRFEARGVGDRLADRREPPPPPADDDPLPPLRCERRLIGGPATPPRRWCAGSHRWPRRGARFSPRTAAGNAPPE